MMRHGQTGTTEHIIWTSMIQRCTNPRSQAWSAYGGRGITVCERWFTFENFYADMGRRPEGLSLDRIDNNGNYEPSNCRWATKEQQHSNCRNTVFIELNGRRLTVSRWAKELNISPFLIYQRLKKGWSTEAVLSNRVMTPSEAGGHRCTPRQKKSK